MRVGLYARCSTVGDRQDPESQLLQLRHYAESRGWEITGEFVDRASAVNLRGRVAWKELLGLAGRRRVDTILVWRLDRAFRSMVHLSTTIEQLRASGVALVSLSEPWVNTADSSPMSDLIRNILGSVAEFERGLISERVRMGLERARKQGRTLGRPAKVNGNLEALRPLIVAGSLSMSAAARQLGVNPSTVSRALRKPHESRASGALVQ